MLLIALQAALSDTCSATVDDLFPAQYNVSDIKAALNRTNPALSDLVPSPFVGFTLLLVSNQAFADANSASCKLHNLPCCSMLTLESHVILVLPL